MSDKLKEQTVGRPEPEFKIDIGTIVWVVIGFVVSWVNMILILDSMEIWSYLTIIFTTNPIITQTIVPISILNSGSGLPTVCSLILSAMIDVYN